jgi:NAD kinase
LRRTLIIRDIESFESVVEKQVTCSHCRGAGPIPLFSEQEVSVNLEANFRRNFDVSIDGQQFIVAQPVDVVNTEDAQASPRINIVLNWFEELKERVPIP